MTQGQSKEITENSWYVFHDLARNKSPHCLGKGKRGAKFLFIPGEKERCRTTRHGCWTVGSWGKRGIKLETLARSSVLSKEQEAGGGPAMWDFPTWRAAKFNVSWGTWKLEVEQNESCYLRSPSDRAEICAAQSIDLAIIVTLFDLK